MPLFLLYQTGFLPRYQGNDFRHDNTISGYSHYYETGAKRVHSVDPHYKDTYFGEHWDPIGSTDDDGSFKAVYEADKAGANYVMIW